MEGRRGEGREQPLLVLVLVLVLCARTSTGSAATATIAGADASDGRSSNRSRSSKSPNIPTDMTGRCRRCFETGHLWYECKASIIPSPAQRRGNGSRNAGEQISWVSLGYISECRRDARNEFRLVSGLETWRGHSAATFHMTDSKSF